MRLVIFDCDGTLVDSQHAIVAAMEHAFASEGLDPPTRGDVLGIVGLSLPEAFRRLAPSQSERRRERLADGYKTAFSAGHIKAERHEPLYPGIAAAITALSSDAGTVLGIATGKSRRGVDRLLSRESWEGAFITIQTADDHPSKPHPAMILTAMAETGVAPHRTVMIGDTTFDMEMAREAGVAALGVAWGYHPVSALHAAGADAVVSDHARLVDEIAGLFGRGPRG